MTIKGLIEVLEELANRGYEDYELCHFNTTVEVAEEGFLEHEAKECYLFE